MGEHGRARLPGQSERSRKEAEIVALKDEVPLMARGGCHYNKISRLERWLHPGARREHPKLKKSCAPLPYQFCFCQIISTRTGISFLMGIARSAGACGNDLAEAKLI